MSDRVNESPGRHRITGTPRRTAADSTVASSEGASTCRRRTPKNLAPGVGLRNDEWRFFGSFGGTNVRPKRRTGDRRRDGVEATGERPPDRRFDKHADPPNDGVDEAPRAAGAGLPAGGIELLGSGDAWKRVGLSGHDQQRAAGGAVPTLMGDRSGAKLHQGGFGGHGELLGPAANQSGRREDLFRIEGRADSRICSGDVSPNRTLPGSGEQVGDLGGGDGGGDATLPVAVVADGLSWAGPLRGEGGARLGGGRRRPTRFGRIRRPNCDGGRFEDHQRWLGWAEARSRRRGARGLVGSSLPRCPCQPRSPRLSLSRPPSGSIPPDGCSTRASSF